MHNLESTTNMFAEYTESYLTSAEIGQTAACRQFHFQPSLESIAGNETLMTSSAE